MSRGADVVAWIERNHSIPAFATAWPGPYRIDNAPYMRGIIEALFESEGRQRVVLVGAAQTGKTELMLALASYTSAQGHPTAVVSPTVRMAEAMRRYHGNEKVKFIGATSLHAMRSAPFRYVFADEIDAYPLDVGGNGDPLDLLRDRTLTFRDGREFWAGTFGGFTSRIARAYAGSDRRRFHIPCPNCDTEQELRFDRLTWPKSCPEMATYTCAACGVLIEEHQKREMLSRGRWLSTVQRRTDQTIGFHLSSLYSLWSPWSVLAREWERAQGDPILLSAVRHIWLAESGDHAEAA